MKRYQSSIFAWVDRSTDIAVLVGSCCKGHLNAPYSVSQSDLLLIISVKRHLWADPLLLCAQ